MYARASSSLAFGTITAETPQFSWVAAFAFLSGARGVTQESENPADPAFTFLNLGQKFLFIDSVKYPLFANRLICEDKGRPRRGQAGLQKCIIKIVDYTCPTCLKNIIYSGACGVGIKLKGLII